MVEKFEFKTEVKQLLELVIHSLYSHKDIFLRELISNAADAIDRLRLESLTNQNLIEANEEWKIKISFDEKKRLLTITDNGRGMTHEELIENLGTIAKSGTKAFVEQLKKNKDQDMNLIGQFGVGFYSAFMVADTVTVLTKAAGEEKAFKWTSTGQGEYEIEETVRDSRGTDVILHINKEDGDYLKEYQLKTIVKKYSDFIEHPIVMDVEKEEEDADKKKVKKIVEETLNSRKAIWAKNKSDIKEEEYTEFYKHLSHDFNNPSKTIHYSAEGTIEFKALLYIPEKAPFDLFYPDSIKGIHLYVKRIFIMDDCKKLIPEYLRFVKGIVDSNDLPLNVSRELLQQDAQLEKIKKNIVSKILQTLQNMVEKEYDKYLKFYTEFGKVLKEGTHYDSENKDKILDICLFQTSSTRAGELKTFKNIVESIPSSQKEIYYLLSDSRENAQSSPHLEIFKKKNIEVVFLLDTIDEWLVNSVFEYKGKNLKAVDKGDIALDSDESEKKLIEEKKEKDKDLLGFMAKQLESDVKEVRFSNRLTDSIGCLVTDENAMSKQMEQMFKSMGQTMPTQKKILELNVNHLIVGVLEDLYLADKESADLKDYVSLIYNQALLTEGSKIKDTLGFTQKLAELMIRAIKK